MRSRFLALLILCLTALACAQQAKPPAAATPNAASRRKVAEGAYDKFDAWTLSALSDKQQLEADINMSVYAMEMRRDKSKPIVQKETMRMDTDFTMGGFRYESENLSGLSDGALDCTVHEESLDCVSTFTGRDRGQGKINVSGGYATQLGVEIALLDMPWFYATLVAQSDRDPKQTRTFGIVTIAFDGQTADTLITGGARDAEVKYVGRETIKVLGHAVSANKFHITAHTYEATVWTADHGLLLAADWADMRIELTDYRQWIPLVPELPVEDQPESKP
jgi:hypothetical protein